MKLRANFIFIDLFFLKRTKRGIKLELGKDFCSNCFDL
jgi:hypothetical protein